jgi:DDE superfamily endonuclease
MAAIMPGCRPAQVTRPGRLLEPHRLPATYHRTHGIRYFHGCYSLGDDKLWGVTRRRKGGDHTLAALKSIRAARPDGAPIYVILDNLSANKTPAIRAWAARNKVELCFTPTNASWANPIEAHFGPLRTFVMGASDHPNHAVLARPGRSAAAPPADHARPQAADERAGRGLWAQFRPPQPRSCAPAA